MRVLLVTKAARPVGSCDVGLELKIRCETFLRWNALLFAAYRNDRSIPVIRGISLGPSEYIAGSDYFFLAALC